MTKKKKKYPIGRGSTQETRNSKAFLAATDRGRGVYMVVRMRGVRQAHPAHARLVTYDNSGAIQSGVVNAKQYNTLGVILLLRHVSTSMFSTSLFIMEKKHAIGCVVSAHIAAFNI